VKASAELTFENTTRMVSTKDYRIQINEAGKGHPIIMIHGGGPGATGWSNYAANIASLSRNFRCIAVTMPGWGESSPQSRATGRNAVEALKQLLDALSIERAALVGNSMGGGVAVAFTAEHEARVSHLITLGVGGVPGVNILQPGVITEGLRVLVQAYEDPSPENIKRFVQILCYDPSFASDELARERSEQARRSPEHNANWLDFWRQPTGPGLMPPTIVPKLMASKVPTLAIHGRDDRASSFEQSLRLVGMMPNSRLVLINRCGHWVQLEHAAEFNRLVADFVANN
jgi:2-hydroxy-6-oxonona-2,4-dienedioate hydrolase